MVKRGDPSLRRDLTVEFEVVATAAQANRVNLQRSIYQHGIAERVEGWLLVVDPEVGEVAGYPLRVVRRWWYEWVPIRSRVGAAQP